MTESNERLVAVRALLLDVDGVLTDGSVELDHAGREVKRFNTQDGFGIRLWMRLGYRVGIITGRGAPALRHRLAELKIGWARLHVGDKAEAVEEFCRDHELEPSEIAAIGDDWPDLPMLKGVGVAIAPANATPAVRERAQLTTERAGGSGAVREAIEHILRAQGRLDEGLALYD